MQLPDSVLSFIIAREGSRFVNNPADRGGPTRYGITQRVYATYRGAKGLPAHSVEHITTDELREIYDRQYWRDGHCVDLAEAGLVRLALVHMDGCVNHGIRQASTLLQRAVGTRDDGVIGPVTVACALSSPENDSITALLIRRAAFYRQLVANDHTQQQFLSGWLARLRHVADAVDVKAPASCHLTPPPAPGASAA